MEDPWEHEERASPESMRNLKELWERPENQSCADCSASDAKWASTNLGVFICTKCSTVHRNLGPEVSHILGVTTDTWTDSQVECMLAVEGNAAANAIFETYPPRDIQKPGPQASSYQRTEWIRRKYEEQEFLTPSLRLKSSKSSNYDADPNASSRATSMARLPSGISRSSSKRSLSKTDTGELGQLKITVHKGRSLVIRDYRSSDPYVKISISQQSVQTKVIESNLNPVWDEEFVLSVPDLTPALPVKLQVFDKDIMSADDAMGEAEVDINPLVEAARMYEGVTMDGGRMQIGRWLSTRDNALTGDSSIWLCDGRITQEMTLKLQNVDTGELDIALEWNPSNARTYYTALTYMQELCSEQSDFQ
ncbi:hypothetical protein R1sor_010627 [Riccia sorocarpa]|uniref:Uncharacterized protein n=1 Tax=Riccia sorocarpa TaxID=122646 RepID=A0ABD3I2M6_9MARC